MRLVLVNFRHHQQLELELPATGVNALVGPNGCGKSTIFEAILFVLYGKLRKVSSFGQKKTAVTLEYDGIALQGLPGVQQLTIMRKKDPCLLQVTCDQVYEDVAAQALINRLFGAEEVFLASSYIRQEERNPLLIGSNSDKLALLQQLSFGSQDIELYKEKISKEYKKTESEWKETEGRVKLLEDQTDRFQVLHARALAALQADARSEEELALALEQLQRNYLAAQAQRQQLEKSEVERAAVINANQKLTAQVEKLRAAQGAKPTVSIEELTQRLEQTKLFTSYAELYTRDLKQALEFKQRYGEAPPAVEDDPAGANYRELATELAGLEAQSRANLQLIQQLNNLPVGDLATLQTELEVAELQAEVAKLPVLPTEIPLNPVYPSDPAIVQAWIQELTSWQSQLALCDGSSQSELQAQATELKGKLSRCGTKVQCPECRMEVLLAAGELKKIPPKRGALPARLGARPVAPVSPPVSSPVCTENAEALNQELAGIELKLARLNALTPPQLVTPVPATIPECEQALSILNAQLRALLNQESSAPFRTRHAELEIQLAGRSTTRSVATIKQALTAQQERERLLAAQQPIDEARLSTLRTLTAQAEKVESTKEQAIAFTRQAELVKAAEGRRRELLITLFSEEVTEPVTWPYSLSEVTTALGAARKWQEVETQVSTLQSSLSEVPVSQARELETARIAEEAARIATEQIKELCSYQAIGQQFTDLKGRLADEQNILRMNKHKFIALDRLKGLATKAEALTLQQTVSMINYELAAQLTMLFSDPIGVRFETSKTLVNGAHRDCINLTINYRNADYDDIRQLSGGEAARVSLAITLALNKVIGAPLLLLDESLAAVDSDMVDEVVDVLKTISGTYQLPVFIVHHSGCTGYYDQVITL